MTSHQSGISRPMGLPRRHHGGSLASAAAAALLAALASSCGGGSTASNGSLTGTTTGIEGTGFMHAHAVNIGAISGFGSVFLDGVEFDTSTAAVSIDGEPASVADLRSGQTVRLTGSIGGTGATGAASQVAADTAAQGPISAIDRAGSSFTVLGLTVIVGPNTSLIGPGGATRLESLAPGTLATVSALVGPGGAVVATRVDLPASVPAYVLTGAVVQADPSTGQFVLDGLTIDGGAAVLDGFPAGGVQDGQVVQVFAPPNPAGGALAATRIRLLPSLAGQSGDGGVIEGVVSQFASTNHFAVDGVPVAVSAATTYVGGTAAQLKTNVRVAVQGGYDASGTLNASALQFLGIDPALVRAPVQAVDAVHGTVTLLGVTFATASTTRFEDLSAAALRTFNLAAVRIGDYLEVRGQPTGATSVAASAVMREDAPTDQSVEVRGTASAVAAPDLTVLGVPAVTGAGTAFLDAGDDSSGANSFFAKAPGSVVDLRGTLSSGTLQVLVAKLPSEAGLDD